MLSQNNINARPGINQPRGEQARQHGQAQRQGQSQTGLRDTVVIALMLSTGIRETELSALTVADLRQRLGGETASTSKGGDSPRQEASGPTQREHFLPCFSLYPNFYS